MIKLISQKTIFVVIFILALFLFVNNKVLAASATLNLSPAYGTYTVGNTFDININLNTGGGRTVGTDIIIKYDAAKLKLVDIVNGTIYTQYVGKEINNSLGTATISGISSDVASAFTGSGTLATLKFQGLTATTATVSFDFTAGGSTDSNVADFDTKADILTSATGGTYNLVAGSAGSADNTTTTTTSSSTDTTSIPDAGLSAPTMALSTLGLISILFGVFYLRKSI